MNELIEIIDRLEELNEAEEELIVLTAGAKKTCSLLLILHTQREEQIEKLSSLKALPSRGLVTR